MSAIGMGNDQAGPWKIILDFGDRFIDSGHVEISIMERSVHKNRARRNGVQNIRKIKRQVSRRIMIQRRNQRHVSI